MIEDHGSAADLLRRALEVEYSFIFHYPRLIQATRYEKVRQSVTLLVETSMSHVEAVARILGRMGEEMPSVPVTPHPESVAVEEWWQRQLQHERLALWLYTEALARLGLSLGQEVAHTLEAIAAEEREHIATVEGILVVEGG